MSVIADFQVNGLFPSVVGGNSTSALYFPRVLGTNGPNGGQSVAPSSTSAAGQLAVPGNSILNGQTFKVLVGASFGSDTGDASGTVTLNLSANTGTVSSPSYTIIATSGAITPNLAQAEDISLEVTLFCSTKSGIVQGYQTGVKNQGVLAQAALTNNLSSINMGNAVPFGLVASVVFGTGNATNTASLYQFQIVGA
jgi:hypothetical protein